MKYVSNYGVIQKDKNRLLPIIVSVALAVSMSLGAIFAANAAKPSDLPAPEKKDICHYSADEDTYHLINISSHAVQKHLDNHGDGSPGVFPFEDDCEKWTAVDDFEVDSASVAGTDWSTEEGANYLFMVEGYWQNGPTRLADAKYISDDDWFTYLEGPDRPDADSELALELQVGEEFVDWGEYSEDHQYELVYTGDGSDLNFRVFDGFPSVGTPNPAWYGDNSGVLSVVVYQLM